ncbi:MAG: CoA transferase [Rhodospirillaceae bacterium]|nr:CoA transferase [Rhodospirillaceae bacterium]
MSPQPASNGAAPLSGIRVIEFCQVAAGPFCGLLLADMGADVIKVEPPGGDSLRGWPPHTGGYGENFAALNRNKRSVVLDLKSADGRAAALALIAAAQVVVENNRPGVMARLGLGYADVTRGRRDLVYCSISAFGQSGPRSGDGGFDVSVQAVSGIMSVTGERDGPPLKAGVPISDMATGLHGAFAIAALLRRVAQGGVGGHIDATMLGASLAVAAFQTSEYYGTGRDPVRHGSAHPRNAPYRGFAAADGHFVLAAGNDKLWQSVCAVLQRPDLAADTRFSTTALRAKNQETLALVLHAEFAKDSVAAWVAKFRAADVPCEPINSISQALSEPQVAHMGWVQPMVLPGDGATRTLVSPLVLDGVSGTVGRRPPALGEHNAEVFREIGYRPAG